MFIICLLISLFVCLISSTVYASDSRFYLTSEGISYSLDEVIVYDTDLYDKDFKSEADIIDYIYLVGYNRTSTAYDYGTDGDSRIDIKGTKLTNAELILFIKNPRFATQMFSIKSQAISKTIELYGYNAEDSIANGFQHAYWIALMYFKLSPSFAIQEGYAHEEYDENDPMSKHMDLYNDNVSYESCSSISYNKDDDKLALALRELVTNGNFIYIKRNYSYPVKRIYYLSSGRVDTIYAVGDFYCYTNSNIPYGLTKVTEIKTKYDIMEGYLMEK